MCVCVDFVYLKTNPILPFFLWKGVTNTLMMYFDQNKIEKKSFQFVFTIMMTNRYLNLNLMITIIMMGAHHHYRIFHFSFFFLLLLLTCHIHTHEVLKKDGSSSSSSSRGNAIFISLNESISSSSNGKKMTSRYFWLQTKKKLFILNIQIRIRFH